MSADPRESDAHNGDDLFDLPSEAPNPVESSPLPARSAGTDVDKPSSALPRRNTSSSPAGPPLTSVEASPTGIRDQVRLRSQPPEELTPAAATQKVGARQFALTPRNLWIAAAATAVVIGFVAGFVVAGGSAQETNDEAPAAPHTASTADHEATTEHVPSPGPEISRAEPVQRAKIEFDASVFEFAQTSIRTARDEMAAGSRGAARARLARVALRIDAIQPSDREAVRADIALLLAQCIQAEADEAARTP